MNLASLETGQREEAGDRGVFAPIWTDRRAWILVSLLVAVQYLLFRAYVIREVVWAYPSGSDQSSYLASSYEILDKMLSLGFWQGLLFGLGYNTPNGVLFQIQLAIASLFFGAGRLTALHLTFAYFALAEAVLVSTIHRITKDWSWAFCGLGLLLLTSSRFYTAGGLDDFRIDCLAWCLFGVVICLLIRSAVFACRSGSLIFGFAATILILFRYITIVYLAGIECVILAALIWMLRNPETRSSAKSRIHNLLLSALPIILLAVPMILSKMEVLKQYYGRHVYSSERGIRAAQEGVASQWDSLMYYPRSLILVHLGSALLYGAVILVCAAVFAKRKATESGEDSGIRKSALLYGLVALLAALLPMTALSFDNIKTPIVVSITIVPFILALVLLIRGLGTTGRSALRVISVLLIVASMAFTTAANSRHSSHSVNRLEEEGVLRMYDTLAAYSAENGWREPWIAVDRISEYASALTFRVMIFERQSTYLPVHLSMANDLFAIGRDAALAAMNKSEFAIVSQKTSTIEAPSLFPFDREMVELQPELMEKAKREMVQLGQYRLRGHDFLLFGRVKIDVQGASGEWLMTEGAKLNVPCRMLQNTKHLLFGGKTIAFEHLKGSLGLHAYLETGGTEAEIPSSLPELGPHYTVDLDFTGKVLSESGSCPVRLTFDRYFVPKDVNGIDDTRKLVVFAPTEFRFR